MTEQFIKSVSQIKIVNNIPSTICVTQSLANKILYLDVLVWQQILQFAKILLNMSSLFTFFKERER